MATTKAQEKAAENKGFWGTVKKYASAVFKGPILAPLTGATVGVYSLITAASPKTVNTKPTNNNGLWFPTSVQQWSPPVKMAPYKGIYEYNAPMVKYAYFNPLPGIKDDGVYGSVNLQSYNHAANAWKTGKAAKGAIQMDRYLWNSKTVVESLNAADKKKGKKTNRDMRGFKFLYNPERVTMSWGAGAYTSNEALLMGLEKINPVSATTSASMISFSIFLNRIEDMNFINKNGSLKVSVDTKAFDGMDPVQRNYAYSNAFSAANPYPTTVSLSDLELIYEKGTMYDVEWLIATLNGFAFRDHVSDLNGKTNDMGFLMQFPVELHLGNRMRYRVQVSDISIEHIIFNTRMVPIWSKVTLTCKRMPDYNLDSDLIGGYLAKGTPKE